MTNNTLDCILENTAPWKLWKFYCQHVLLILILFSMWHNFIKYVIMWCIVYNTLTIVTYSLKRFISGVTCNSVFCQLCKLNIQVCNNKITFFLMIILMLGLTISFPLNFLPGPCFKLSFIYYMIHLLKHPYFEVVDLKQVKSGQ